MTGSPRGTTLVELAIGLVLATAVCGAAYQALLVSQRASRAQAEHAAMQDNVRAGMLIVASELRELGFDSVPALAALGGGERASSDILLAEPGRTRYRAMRGLGYTCAAPSVSQVLLRAGGYLGARQPAAGVDSISLFVEGDAALAGDDAWVRAGVGAVSAGTCADGAAGIALTLSWEDASVGAAAAARAATGGPVRIFEIMELQYYRQDGGSWLGMRSVSRGEFIQPLVGPLADSTVIGRGFTLGYLDRNDAPTATPAEIRSVTVSLHGVTAQAVRAAAFAPPAVDSFALASRVALRNMLRP